MSSTKTPVILGFEPGESLSALNTIALGVGWSWGEVTMPFTPLAFTRERIAAALGPGSGYLNGHLTLDNKTFYENTYTGLPLVYKKKFWGEKHTETRKVGGFTIGLGAGKSLADATKSVVKVLATTILRKILSELLQRVSADALQSSTSSDALLYGLNGSDTYNRRMMDFNPDTNMLFISTGMGAVTALALNIVFIGYFPTMPEDISDLPAHLWYAYNHAVAWTIVADAAVGLILPGASIAFISS